MIGAYAVGGAKGRSSMTKTTCTFCSESFITSTVKTMGKECQAHVVAELDWIFNPLPSGSQLQYTCAP